MEESVEGPQREGREYVAPIMVNDQRLGTIRMTASDGTASSIDETKLASLAQKFNLDLKQLKTLATSLMAPATPGRRQSSSFICWPTRSPGFAFRNFSFASGSPN